MLFTVRCTLLSTCLSQSTAECV